MSARKPSSATASPTETKFISTLKFRGANLSLLQNHSPELLICSPSDTGKTVAACYKSIVVAGYVPNCHGAIVRRTYNSLHESVVKTFDRVAQGLGIKKYGGEHAEKYIFSNGSEIVLAGLDKPEQSNKLLSSEWDFIQVCQAEELREGDWEVMASRCTGRGAVIPHPQIFGDLNPAGARHWIRTRALRGALTLLNGTHKDNPELYDDAGNITEEGKKRIGKLESTLTGVRRERLLKGVWATAEGTVYEFSQQGYTTKDIETGLMRSVGPHVVTRERSEMKRFFLALDEGYTNPAVMLDIGEDGDGRWHLFRAFYKRGVLQETVVQTARAWNLEHRADVVAVDEAAAGLIADLNDCGLSAQGGKGRVMDGIAQIQNRLKNAGDGKPRLTIDPSCVDVINEFESYVWKPEKDVPVKENDHAMDALRYLADVLGEPTGILTDRQAADFVKVNRHEPTGPSLVRPWGGERRVW